MILTTARCPSLAHVADCLLRAHTGVNVFIDAIVIASFHINKVPRSMYALCDSFVLTSYIPRTCCVLHLATASRGKADERSRNKDPSRVSRDASTATVG